MCRLMHFDLETLYELHYQMITLGKVGYYLVISFAIAYTAKASQRSIILKIITAQLLTS